MFALKFSSALFIAPRAQDAFECAIAGGADRILYLLCWSVRYWAIKSEQLCCSYRRELLCEMVVLPLPNVKVTSVASPSVLHDLSVEHRTFMELSAKNKKHPGVRRGRDRNIV